MRTHAHTHTHTHTHTHMYMPDSLNLICCPVLPPGSHQDTVIEHRHRNHHDDQTRDATNHDEEDLVLKQIPRGGVRVVRVAVSPRAVARQGPDKLDSQVEQAGVRGHGSGEKRLGGVEGEGEVHCVVDRGKLLAGEGELDLCDWIKSARDHHRVEGVQSTKVIKSGKR